MPFYVRDKNGQYYKGIVNIPDATKDFRILTADGRVLYRSKQSVLPAGYTQVECIQSGKKQYIDTGIAVSGDLSFDIKFYSHSGYSSVAGSYGSIFGGRKSSGLNELQLTTYQLSSADRGTFRLGDESNAALLNKTGINVVQYDVDGNYIVNGTTIRTITHPSFTQEINITLFALNSNNTITQYGNVEMYYFKLYKSGVLVRDYLPCIRESDNTPGMYDRVSKTFYGSATATPFIVPST